MNLTLLFRGGFLLGSLISGWGGLGEGVGFLGGDLTGD